MSKIIEEFPNYVINEEGVIFNSETKKALKQNFFKSKFPMVSLRKIVDGKYDDKSKTDLRYDILVANAFLTNPTNSTVLNHKDGKIANCHPDNLEWKINIFHKSYILYYPLDDGKYRLYNSDTKTIITMDKLPNFNNSRIYHVTKPYEDTDEDMLRYADDFEISVKQLRESVNFKFDYLFAYNHNVATTNFFNQTCKGKFEHHTKQEALEYSWSKRCNNQAPLYCEKGTYQCYGYDFSFNHGTIMAKSEIKLPNKKGKEYYLEELPSKIKVGYYHVRITSKHKNIAKVFYFSKENVYTNIDLSWAIKNSKKYKFDIELIIDDNPNAYLYSSKDCEYSKDIFDNWYDILVKLRKEFPKNILVKFMCSSLHGQLARANTFYKTKQEVKDEGLDICYSDTADYKIVDYTNFNFGDRENYKLLLNKEPYKHNVRLQSFLMSECRRKMAEIVKTDIDNVIRIHTDNITFKNVDPKFKIEGFKPEEKTTGLLKWEHVNKCERVTC